MQYAVCKYWRILDIISFKMNISNHSCDIFHVSVCSTLGLCTLSQWLRCMTMYNVYIEVHKSGTDCTFLLLSTHCHESIKLLYYKVCIWFQESSQGFQYCEHLVNCTRVIYTGLIWYSVHLPILRNPFISLFSYFSFYSSFSILLFHHFKLDIPE